MADKPENPPAFPATGEGLRNPLYSQLGMTLRDYLAAKAMAAALENTPRLSEVDAPAMMRAVAVISYAAADAMLAERERGQ
jgi:hypothetical protein